MDAPASGSPPPAPPPGSIVLGVTPRQPEVVARAALRLARALGAELYCAQVDLSAYVVAEHPDGSVETRPVEPDGQDWTSSRFDPQLAARLERLAAEHGTRLRLRALAGDVAHALGHLAEVVDAELIVVGGRSGVRASMREHFGGSVAVHLVHRQARPVLVVPLAAGSEGPLPWENG